MIFQFEEYTLDIARGCLRIAEREVELRPKSFDVLRYLVENAGRLVTKAELIDKIWPDVLVSEESLSRCISEVREAVADGHHRIIKTVPRRGYRFIAQVRESSEAGDGPDATPKNAARPAAGGSSEHAKQAVTFCRTVDGVNLAVASVGCGPVLVHASSLITHIEYDWQNLVTGPLLQRLADRFHLVRYDGRGFGLSDRDVPISFETMLYDLEAVVDALALKRFALLGISGGAATSIAYAVRHPHRVSKLVLCGGYAQGRNKRNSPRDAAEAQAFLTMLGDGWNDDRLIYARAVHSFFLPAGTPEQLKSLIDLVRASIEGRAAANPRRAVDDIDIVKLLPKVNVPTIAFHCIHDRLVPFDQGRRLAASIPNIRFVPLNSENHVLLADEPAWAKFVGEMEAFLSDGC